MPRSSNKDLPSLADLQELEATLKASGTPDPSREITDTKAEAFDRVLDINAIRAEKAKRNLKDFIAGGWHIVEPKNPYVDNWHIGAVCESARGCSGWADQRSPNQHPASSFEIHGQLRYVPTVVLDEVATSSLDLCVVLRWTVEYSL